MWVYVQSTAFNPRLQEILDTHPQAGCRKLLICRDKRVLPKREGRLGPNAMVKGKLTR